MYSGKPSGCTSTQWKIGKLSKIHYSPPVHSPTPTPVHTPALTFTHTPIHTDPPCLADSTSGIETCDHIVFSANTCNVYNAIRKRHILLDTCAGESVFNDSSLLYNVEHAPTPMIVSGVNPKGKPLIVKERGESAFGNVYYSPNTVFDDDDDVDDDPNRLGLGLGSFSRTKLFSELGIVPPNLFSVRSKRMRLVKSPKELGMEPLNWFTKRINSWRLDMLPRELGKEPVNLFN